eukprot:comp21861_c0_seq1/m.31247 comp21861_c0_seq1/g.31247  ORF comp21861_c0_seq1/g.31247 comp21861_c0_seq1/m.31247 type:complete len:418 (-) comp21861_c0_seq1:71-1324(-)
MTRRSNITNASKLVTKHANLLESHHVNGSKTLDDLKKTIGWKPEMGTDEELYTGMNEALMLLPMGEYERIMYGVRQRKNNETKSFPMGKMTKTIERILKAEHVDDVSRKGIIWLGDICANALYRQGAYECGVFGALKHVMSLCTEMNNGDMCADYQTMCLDGLSGLASNSFCREKMITNDNIISLLTQSMSSSYPLQVGMQACKVLTHLLNVMGVSPQAFNKAANEATTPTIMHAAARQLIPGTLILRKFSSEKPHPVHIECAAAAYALTFFKMVALLMQFGQPTNMGAKWTDQFIRTSVVPHLSALQKCKPNATRALLVDAINTLDMLGYKHGPSRSSAGPGPNTTLPSWTEAGDALLRAQTQATKWALCAHCNASESADNHFKRCSGCMQAKYCGRECQMADWKAGHKTACKPSK